MDYNSDALSALIDVLEYMVGDSAKQSRSASVAGGSPCPSITPLKLARFDDADCFSGHGGDSSDGTPRASPRPMKRQRYTEDASANGSGSPRQLPELLTTPPPVVSRVPVSKFRAPGSSPITRATPDSLKTLDREDVKALKPRRTLTDAEAAHKVLVTLRDTLDPRGAEFMAIVDSIYAASPKSPIVSREISALLSEHGARSKYILRKLAFSLVPNVKEARVAFIRGTMKLADVKTEENQVTKQEAYEIIRAAYCLDPANIRIPELHSRAQTAQAMYMKDSQ